VADHRRELRSTRLATLVRDASCAIVMSTVCGGAFVSAEDDVDAARLAMAASAGALVAPAAAGPESLLLAALDGIARGDLLAATAQVQSLVQAEPDFRLAHLVLGDLLAVSAGSDIGRSDGEQSAALENLLAEARQRVAASHFRPAGMVPAALLQLDPNQASAIVVDASLSRLYLFQRDGSGGLMLTANYYATIGSAGMGKQLEGDLLTPLGVYRVIRSLPGETLPDQYGPLAFPVDYPNAWDQRFGRTGSGIWLHGVPSDTYSRPPLATEGCVAIANDELIALADRVQVGVTPVLLADQVEWITREELSRRRDEIAAIIEAWRTDWSSQDGDAYLAHYAEDFSSRGMDLAAWSAYKRRVNGAKQFIDVQLEDVSILAHPAEADLVVATFEQHYLSDTFSTDSIKQLYLRRGEDGRWRIVLETTL
jgi:murein L,D-transpeptidase YafK